MSLRRAVTVGTLALGASGCSLLFEGGGLFGGDDEDTGQSATQSFAAPTVLASGLSAPHAIAADATKVVAVTEAPDGIGDVVAVDPSGGPLLLLAQRQEKPRAPLVDAVRVYWAAGETSGGHTYIRMTPKAGGVEPKPLYRVSGWGIDVVASMAIEGSTLAWTKTNPSDVGVVRGTTDGATPLDVDGSAVGGGVAIANQWLYFGVENKLLRKAGPKEAGAPEIVAMTNGIVRAVAHRDGVVYAVSDDGSIRSVPVAAGEVKTLVTGLVSPRGIAVDASHVFTATAASGSTGASVVAVPKDGGSATKIADATEPYDVAVAGDSVYFVDRAAGTIVRVQRR